MDIISIDDNITFSTSAKVLNTCFGKEYKGYQKAVCKLSGDMQVWFPKLALVKDGQYEAQSKTKPWINVLSDDGKTLEMIAGSDGYDAARIMKRAGVIFTFAKSSPSEGYRYIGTFVLVPEESTAKSFIHRRIDTAINLKEIFDNCVPELEDEQEKHAKKLSDSQLYRIAKARGTSSPQKTERRVESTKRDQYVSACVKRRAKGLCELCKKPAPFNNKVDEPYLESHHIRWLSQGGSDTIENCVALCPNCHRKMHVLNEKEDLAILCKVPKYISV